jgi:hypothetical protein
VLKKLEYEVITPEDLYPSTVDHNIYLQVLNSFLHPLRTPSGHGYKNRSRNKEKKKGKKSLDIPSVSSSFS